MEARPNLIARFRTFWKGLKKSLRYLLIGMLALLMVVIGIIIFNNTVNKQYEVLRTSLTPDEAAQIVPLLDDWGIDYRLKNQGATIEVPEGERDSLLLRLRNEGYPADFSDSAGDYMQAAMGLGATDYDKLRANEQRLGSQISAALRQFDRVRDASVLVSLPQQSSYSFGNNQQPAQASVMLTLNDINSPLTQPEASSIRSAVQMAVPALLPENISITDSAMNSYPVPSEDGISSAYLGDQLELRRRAQELIQNQVYNILTPVFGYDSVRVTASVELDFDRRSTQSVTYEPPGDQENMGIIVSLDQTATRVTGEGFLGGTVGFDPNGAATPMYPEGWTEAAGEDYYTYTQKINAEVNEVREQVEQQMGKFRSIAVSVMFDAGEEWDETEAREELIQAVAAAVGVENASVNLMRAAFEQPEEVPAPDPVDDGIVILGIPLMYWLIGFGVILLFVFLLIMMQRSAKKRRLAYEEQIARMEEEARLLEAQQFAQAQQEEIAGALDEDDPVRVRLGEIQNLAAEKPEIVAQLLRNWLMDDYGR